MAIFGVVSFLQLGLGSYLLGQVEFAFVDEGTPILLKALRYACVAVPVAGLFHYLRAALTGRRRSDG